MLALHVIPCTDSSGALALNPIEGGPGQLARNALVVVDLKNFNFCRNVALHLTFPVLVACRACELILLLLSPREFF